MRISRLILFFSLVSLAFLSSCYKDGPCIKGNGNIVSETRTVDEFSGIESSGSFDVYVTEDNVSSIRIEAESNIMSSVKTIVRGSILEISTKGCIRKNKTIKVYISAKNLESADISGSGTIKGMNTFHPSSFTARISGSGDINFDVVTERVITEIDGSGDITLSSPDTATHLETDISGSGNLHAFSFPVREAEVEIDGSGNVEVYVLDDLDVDISGSGDVWYKGSPKVNSKTSGSGGVHSK